MRLGGKAGGKERSLAWRPRDAYATGGPIGPYTLQAGIAACHARARAAEDTDWERIVALYDGLAQLAPSPVVELNRAVAVGMAFGPQAALEIVNRLREEPALDSYHLLPSVRGDLLENWAASMRPGPSSSGPRCSQRTRGSGPPCSSGRPPVRPSGEETTGRKAGIGASPLTLLGPTPVPG